MKYKGHGKEVECLPITISVASFMLVSAPNHQSTLDSWDIDYRGNVAGVFCFFFHFPTAGFVAFPGFGPAFSIESTEMKAHDKKSCVL